MTQPRWMSLNDVFEELEEEETRHILQLWERDQASADPGPEQEPFLAAAPRRHVAR